MAAFGAIADWSERPIAAGEIDALMSVVPHRGSRTAQPLLVSGARATTAFGLVDAAPGGDLGSPDIARDRERNLAVVADAIIYNRGELARELGLPLQAGAGDVLIAGYDRWGRDLFARLDGDFALVIWDGRRGEVIAARDPFGVRTLHYWSTGRRLVIASEAKQILVGAGAPVEPDLPRLAEFILDRAYSHTRSFFRDIERLGPGHMLIANANGIAQVRYWQPPMKRLEPARNSAARVEQFRALFTSAVAKRLVSGTPVVMELSGGHDSSSIAAVAHELNQSGNVPATLAALSYTYDGLPTDESIYIRAFLDARKLDWIPIPCDTGHFDALWPTAMWRTDSPFADLQRPMRVQAEAAAQARGARVLLSGFGGDDVLYDAEAFGDLVYSRHWLALINERPSWRAVAAQVTPQPVKSLVRSVWPRPPETWPGWVADGVGSLLPEPCPLPDGLTYLQADLWQWLALRSRVSWMTGWYASGTEGLDLEPRFPFLDRDLFAFLFSVPLHERLPHRSSKRLLRDAMPGLLPPLVLDRTTKAEFSSYYGLVLKRAWPTLRDRVLGQDSQSELANTLFDQAEVEAAVHRWLADPSPTWSVTFPVWRIACTKLWLASLPRYREAAAAVSRAASSC